MKKVPYVAPQLTVTTVEPATFAGNYANVGAGNVSAAASGQSYRQWKLER